MKSGIYIIHNKVTKKNYIGSAVDVNHRWSIHKYELNSGDHHCVYLLRAWKKYGASKFKFIKVQDVLPENLIIQEQKWLDTFEQKFKYNTCKIAGSTLGMKWKQSEPRTKEHCEKISIAAKERLSNPNNHTMFGKIHSEKSNQMNRLSHLGKKHSIESKIKIGGAQLGRKRSIETRNKMSNSMGDKWLITFPDNHKEEIISLSKFCKEHKLSSGNFVNHGHTKGYKAEKITS